MTTTIKIPRAAMLKTLDVVVAAVGGYTPHPVSLLISRGVLRICAMTERVKVVADVIGAPPDADAGITVPMDAFARLIRLAADDMVTLAIGSTSSGTACLHIDSHGTLWPTRGVDAMYFLLSDPDIDSTIDASSLRAGLMRALPFAAGDDNPRFFLAAVKMVQDDTHLLLTATDGIVLTSVAVDASPRGHQHPDTLLDQEYVMPTAGVRALCAALRGSHDAQLLAGRGCVGVQTAESWGECDLFGLCVVTRCYDAASYPVHNSLLPEPGACVEFCGADLSAAISAAAAVRGDDDRVKITLSGSDRLLVEQRGAAGILHASINAASVGLAGLAVEVSTTVLERALRALPHTLRLSVGNDTPNAIVSITRSSAIESVVVFRALTAQIERMH